MKVSHFSWQKRKRWLRGQLWNSPLFTLTSILFFLRSRFHPPVLFPSLYCPPSCSFAPVFLIYLFISAAIVFALSTPFSFFLILSSLFLSPLSLSPLSDSGSISSASRVILLSQWPITQSHCLSSGTDRISRICRPTRHTCSLLLARTLSLGHLSLRHGQTTCGFFFVCGKNK